MKRKFISIFIALVLALSLCLVTAVPVAATSAVFVDGNAATGWYDDPTHFATIQEGITAVDPGGTVNVAAGMYTEQVTIEKPNLTVEGAGKETTFIEGSGNYVVTLKANSINFSGFTIRSTDTTEANCGLKLFGASDCNLSELTIENITYTEDMGGGAKGIELLSSSQNNQFSDIDVTNIRGNDASGVYVHADCNGNTFENLRISNVTGEQYYPCCGLWSQLADGNSLTDSVISGISGPYACGVYLEDVEGDVIARNQISDITGGSHGAGIMLNICNEGRGSNLNTIEANTISGLSGTGYTYGIYLWGSSENTITGNDISDAYAGIRIVKFDDGYMEPQESANNRVENCTITGNTFGVSVSDSSGNEIHYSNICGNSDYGIYNSNAGVVNATNNWWGDDGCPGVGQANGVSADVTYDPWIGKAETPSDHEDIADDAAATLDLKGGQPEGSTLYVDMNEGKTGTFNAVEETGAPSQGFIGMGDCDKGIAKTIAIMTDADDGDFVMCVKLYYTDTELSDSGINEDDLRLYYWDTKDDEWKLAVDGNTTSSAQWMGDSAAPAPATSGDLGKHGVDQTANIAWAVVDHCTEYGAGEVEGQGEFEISPPIVEVTFTPDSMTPQSEQTVTVNVEVDSTLTLDDLTSLEFKVWYDEGADDDLITTDADEDGIPDVFEDKTAATQTCAVITWSSGTPDAFSIDSQADGEATTTWSLGTCSKPADMSTATSGDFILNFTPGKVATEADVTNNIWQLAASVGSTHGGNGFDYEVSTQGAGMDWYGQLSLSAAVSVDWGVVPAGLDFAEEGLSEEAIGAIITIISNGAYDLKAKAGDWEGLVPDNTATLDSSGVCDSAGHFALKADDDNTLEDTMVLDASGVVIASGSLTVEDGMDYANATLWLKLAKTFVSDTYSGLITYMIANGNG